MSVSQNNIFKINIDNFSGPLDVLLDLAKAQKVDLANISITQLADQFIEYITSVKKQNLDPGRKVFGFRQNHCNFFVFTKSFS